MASVPHAGREIAREWAKRAAACGLSLGVATPVAGALVGTALAGPFALSAALAAIAAWRANQFADDPPAYDFQRSAAVRPLPLDLSIFPSTSPQRELAALTDGFSQTEAALGATLRAFERAQGASLSRRDDMMKKQLHDTSVLAAQTASRLGTLTSLLTAVDVAFRENDALSFTESEPERTGALRFDDPTLAFLYRSGLAIKELYRALETMSSQRDDRVASPTQAVDGLIRPTAELADFLRTWQPQVGGR